MRCFKLQKPLIVSDICERQTIYTETIPYVYLSSNGIFFSKIKTKNPIEAFKRSATQLFFYSLDNASTAFDAIHSAARAGYDRIDIDEHNLRDITFGFVHE